MRKIMTLLLLLFLLAGCTSVGTVGIVTKSSAEPVSILKNGQAYKELGVAQGEACRFFLLGIFPWGDATFSTAVDDALSKAGGDAMVNVTVSNSLYGFLPVFYNVFSYTCTDVKGIAVKFENKK